MDTRSRVLIGSAIAVVVAALAFGGWYFFLRDDAPPPASLEDAVSSVRDRDASSTPTGTVAATEEATTEATPTATAATSTATVTATATEEAISTASSEEDLVGRWVIAEGSESFVGYRVNEELANIGAKTAVGRTSALTGVLDFDGSAITTVEVEADLTQLKSDDSRRDRTLGNQAIETATFPTATFVLTEPIAVAPPGEGETIAATVSGELTLHGVTRAVSIDLEGQFVEGFVVVVGSTEIVFADYDIDPPRALAVLSIEDHGTMEFQLVFAPA